MTRDGVADADAITTIVNHFTKVSGFMNKELTQLRLDNKIILEFLESLS